jgi:metal-dependent amidase/aminoacylase/carboxypeptidase family protein
MALGCCVEIDTMPGYLPLRNNADLTEVFKENAGRLFGSEQYRDYAHSGGSTDAGDLSQIMPDLHPSMTGAVGGIHGPDWHIADSEAGYLAPAKTLAMMVVDLLADGGELAQRVLAQDQPAMSKNEYLEQQLRIFRS